MQALLSGREGSVEGLDGRREWMDVVSHRCWGFGSSLVPFVLCVLCIMLYALCTWFVARY